MTDDGTDWAVGVDVGDLEIVEQFVIPKCSARAIELKQGQRLRVIAHEGKQVADLKFFNLHNLKEQFAANWSVFLNLSLGVGTAHRITRLYSGPPFENVLATVTDDPVGKHLPAGSCSRGWAELMGGMSAVIEGDKTCWDLFDTILPDYGIEAADTDAEGTFNVFMVVSFAESGATVFEPPSCEIGDHVEFRAETDLLVAATSCPDTNEINDFKPKAMAYMILE